MGAKELVFKTKKSSTKKESTEVVVVTENLEEHITNFKKFKSLEKEAEAGLAIAKDGLNDLVKEETAKRLANGKTKGFKLTNGTDVVSYIVMNKGRDVSGDYDQLVETYGEEKIDKMVDVDWKGIKFDTDLLTKHKEKILQYLMEGFTKDLGEEAGMAIFENLFVPASIKAKKNVLDEIASNCKNQEEAGDLIRDLKITAYLKG
jgi:hypothetical protein